MSDTEIIIIFVTLMVIFHEGAHYFFDKYFSDVIPHFKIRLNLRRLGFFTEAEIPLEIIPRIRENPSKFVVNRTWSRAIGGVGIIPLWLGKICYPHLTPYFTGLIIFWLIYTIWETSLLPHNYLNDIFVKDPMHE